MKKFAESLKLITDKTRDNLLTDLGKKTLIDRYLLPGEDFQDLFARVATAYCDDFVHAQRIYDYMSKHWFMPATPILANGGTDRGLPISCYLNEVLNSMKSISGCWSQNVWLAYKGGGIGTSWSNISYIGEKDSVLGASSGVIPLIKVSDSMTLAISQGNLRRGSSAAYLHISHPEIEEFVDLRRPTGGDPNRRSLNIHHGVVITDAFMEAVVSDDFWTLKSPGSGLEVKKIKARQLWIKILSARIETGEPYILFIDNVNRRRPDVVQKLGLEIKTSNLCSEIVLPTGIDHLGKERTAVCCLSSVNLEYFEEWEKDANFIEDIMRFLDNVLSDFIAKAPVEMQSASYAASRERSVGLGVMGFHSFLQKKHVPMSSVVAKVWNKRMFSHIKILADAASQKLAKEKGACPDAAEVGLQERFSHKIAVAPTASISIITGSSSPGIEPFVSNGYNSKTLTGFHFVKNKNLVTLLERYSKNDDKTWNSITLNEGSVQHLDFLKEYDKEVFKTAAEIDQKVLIELAANRTPYICQAQSLNLFFEPDVNKKYLHEVHFNAWQSGVKSLYYCRSKSMRRAENKISAEQTKNAVLNFWEFSNNNNEECLSCQ